jgi:GH35 family endo-1,4-beta-xylanase
VNAHTLIWHSQLPAFARRLQNVDSFKTFFTEHIKTVASRYDGKVQSWDVVNEALNEDGTMRKSVMISLQMHLGSQMPLLPIHNSTIMIIIMNNLLNGQDV